MSSLRSRGRGRGAPVGSGGNGDASSRRGTWRGGPPGSAQYAGRNSVPGSGPRQADQQPKPDERTVRAFQTDTDISASTRPAERELKPWVSEEIHPVSNGAVNGANGRDSMTFGPPNVPWDQFEVNERLFGAKTDYEEEIYTTKLDRSAADYKKREREADKLANEIMSKSASNSHIAEERNQVVADETKDEEERYSGVARNPNAYVPPGARKSTPAGLPVRPKTDGLTIPFIGSVSPKTPPPASKSNGAGTPPLSGNSESPSNIVVDPAIASQGLAPIARSTSAVPPPAANGEPDSKSTSVPVPSLTVAPPPITPVVGAVVDQARQFVVSERERVEARKQSIVKSERAQVLANLKNWQTSFKVPLPIPKDILPILTKDEGKQKAIEQKASAELHEVEARKLLKSPQIGTAPDSSKGAQAQPHTKKIAMKIPEIPPFKKKMPPAVPVPETASQSIALATSPTPSQTSLASGTPVKLNPNANTFVFKPNPTAPAFKPAGSSGSSPASNTVKLQPSGLSASTSSTSTAPKNAFFRDGPPRRISVNPREDFNPWKHGQVPPATSVSPQWPYTGRRSSVALGPPGHIMPMGPGGFEEESSPHGGPPQLIPGMQPNFMPYYRYQPGMPPQGLPVMQNPMFPPGYGHLGPPQGMGQSPPHLGQGLQQGPGGMPMYFANGMPSQPHFLPQQQMHFHPNGPGRPGPGPGPGGPMYYSPGQMPPQQHQTPQMQPHMQFSGQPTTQPHFQQSLPVPGPPPAQASPHLFEGTPAH